MTAAGPLLLDTCAIIYIATGQVLTDAAHTALMQAIRDSELLVSPVSAWEIGLLSRKPGGPEFHPDPKTWFADFLDRRGVRLTALTPDIAIDSSHLPPPFHGDPADRMIVATARALGVPVITRDRKILAYAEAGRVGVIPC